MTTASRLLLLAYLAALLVVVLTSTSTLQSDVITWSAQQLAHTGVPARLRTYDRLEVLANVLMVVPVGLLGGLSFPRVRWQTWTAYAFLGSLTVELVQGLLLPDREAAMSDVVANTLGALLGAVVAVAVAWVVRRRAGSTPAV